MWAERLQLASHFDELMHDHSSSVVPGAILNPLLVLVHFAVSECLARLVDN